MLWRILKEVSILTRAVSQAPLQQTTWRLRWDQSPPLWLSRPVNPMALIQGVMNHCFPDCPAACAAKCLWCAYSPCTRARWKHPTCCSLSCWRWAGWVAQRARCSFRCPYWHRERERAKEREKLAFISLTRKAGRTVLPSQQCIPKDFS